MRISEQFAGNYLKASDLPQPKVFTIAGCETATMPDQTTKPALRFAGEPQQLILNKTNAYCLAEWFGDDTNGWLNRQVELYSTTTSFSGRMVPAIRVRQAPQWQQPPAQQQPQPVPQQMQSAQQQQPQPVPQQYVQQTPVPQPQAVQQYAAQPVPMQPAVQTVVPQAAPPADYPIDA
jgi:hypothetical protein